MALLGDLGLTLGKWAGRPSARVQKDSGDPAVGRVREAAEAADWATVREVLEARPESENRVELLWAVGDTAGVERWIARVLEAEPEAPLPRLVAGIRHISWGWEARTGARASQVSREQFEVFHTRLRTAEKWLYEAAEREPQWTSPWYGLQVSGRGLQVGQDTARRRFEATVRRDPHHLEAHQQQLQQLCDKWGGSHEEMHAFARESAFKAPMRHPARPARRGRPHRGVVVPRLWAGRRVHAAGPRWGRPCGRPPTIRSGIRTSSAGAVGTRC